MTENPKREQRSLNFKPMAKKTCPECDGELLEDGSCPACGSLDEDTEETEKDADLETEESTE